jgi:hypothetical protein
MPGTPVYISVSSACIVLVLTVGYRGRVTTQVRAVRGGVGSAMFRAVEASLAADGQVGVMA